MKTKKTNNEELEQTWLIQWATMLSSQHKELALLHHIPNGGLRSKSEAKRLKAAGVKSGVPDLCLPVARQGYHGLYMELKAGKGKATASQKQWLDSLNNQGYKAIICYGWIEGAKELADYLNIEIEI